MQHSDTYINIYQNQIYIIRTNTVKLMSKLYYKCSYIVIKDNYEKIKDKKQ